MSDFTSSSNEDLKTSDFNGKRKRNNRRTRNKRGRGKTYIFNGPVKAHQLLAGDGNNNADAGNIFLNYAKQL